MRLSDIDLRLLRVFKSVAEHGGIVKAQAALGINQPTISSHIANLEKRLNVRLCNRGPQGFSLTEEGQDVLTETEKLLAYLDKYTGRMETIGKKKRRRLRIGVIDCLASDPDTPLHRSIRETESQIGELDIQLGIYDYLDCLSELRDGRVDLIILGFDEAIPSDILAQPLYDEISGLFCATDHACATASSLNDLHNLLKNSKVSAQSYALDPIDSELNALLLGDFTDISVGHCEATAHLILAGTHVGILPIHFAHAWVERGQMKHLNSRVYSVTSHIHVARLKAGKLNTAAATLWENLANKAGVRRIATHQC